MRSLGLAGVRKSRHAEGESVYLWRIRRSCYWEMCMHCAFSVDGKEYEVCLPRKAGEDGGSAWIVCSCMKYQKKRTGPSHAGNTLVTLSRNNSSSIASEDCRRIGSRGRKEAKKRAEKELDAPGARSSFLRSLYREVMLAMAREMRMEELGGT